MNKYYIVSFSGGKDSTAMLLRLLELQEPIDEVIFCDTYKEFPAMYEHVAKVRLVVEQANIKFTELRAEKDFDYYMFEHQPKRRNAQYAGLPGYSWAGAHTRWCCPLKSLSELRNLRKYYPELWQELIEMDNRTWRQYRADYSVKQLDKRFAFEEEFASRGKSIRSREFFKQLKERLEE